MTLSTLEKAIRLRDEAELLVLKAKKFRDKMKCEVKILQDK